MQASKELVLKMIESLMDGASLKSELVKHGLSPSQFFTVINENPSIEDLYIRAQASRTELMVEEIVEIADTEPDANRARVRTDARKWYASKMNSKKYGDRIDLNVNQTVDIGKALAEARARSGQSVIKDAQPIELPILGTSVDDDDIFD